MTFIAQLPTNKGGAYFGPFDTEDDAHDWANLHETGVLIHPLIPPDTTAPLVIADTRKGGAP